MASDQTAAFRSSYPIGFNLLDDDDMNVIYMTDDANGNTIYVEIENQSEQDIIIPTTAGGTASTDTHQFELLFNSGTLVDTVEALDTIINNNSNSDWSIKYAKSTNDGTVSFYVLYNAADDLTLTANGKLRLELDHVIADGSGGSRGTQVELRYQNLTYNNVTDDLTGNRVEHVNLINHIGKEDIPLHVGFVNSNKILNDSLTGNNLKIRLSNLLSDDSSFPSDSYIYFNVSSDDGPSKIIVSFEMSDDDDSWALTTTGESTAPTCTLNIDSSVEKDPEESDQAKVTWKQQSYEKVGIALEWTFTPDSDTFSDTYLEAGKHYQIELSNIVSNAPNGQANIYIRYENIPGYWDGQFVLVAEKGPLVYDGSCVRIGTTGATGWDAEDNVLKLKASTTMTGDDGVNIDTSGNVGVGTSSPLQILHLKLPTIDDNLDYGLMIHKQQSSDSGGAATGILFAVEGGDYGKGGLVFERTASYARGKIHFLQNNEGNHNIPSLDDSVLTIDNEGKVGIGTTSAIAGLHVKNLDSNDAKLILEGGTSDDPTVNFRDPDGQKAVLGWDAGDQVLKLKTGTTMTGSEGLNIDENGNVGIGTSSPSSVVDIVRTGSNDPYTILHVRSTASQLAVGDYGGSLMKLEVANMNITGSVIGLEVDLSGSTIGSPVAATFMGGNVGIGTTSPGSSKLKVANSDTDFADIRFSGSGMGQLEMVGWSSGWNINTETNGKHLYLNRDSGSSSDIYIGRKNEELYVRGSDGYVGIGTTSPGFSLEVNGTAAKAGGGFWFATSDKRLKDIGSPFKRGLEALEKLKPVAFNYKKDNPLNLPSDRQHIGLIAQEVKKAIPEAVEKGKDGYLFLNNDAILWTMLNSIKELKAENEKLQKQVAKLVKK